MKTTKKLNYILCLIVFSLLCTGCFNEKKSVFYNSEWIMENTDETGKPYIHQLFLKPDHKVTMQVYYKDNSAVIVWTGTYKLSSKKINFDFTQASRFENNQSVGNYTSGKVINYFDGDFYYSAGLIGENASSENQQYHLQLIRPKKYFYGENLDFFGNPMEEFIKIDN